MKKSFEGLLVEQGGTDEPASALFGADKGGAGKNKPVKAAKKSKKSRQR